MSMDRLQHRREELIKKRLLLREILKKEAPNDLIAFTSVIDPSYQAARHHYKISGALMRVIRGECKRLMIICPPRHGKSTLASRMAPAFFLGHHPAKDIICCSYNADLAYDFGRAVRDVMQSPEYIGVFPETSIRPETTAADRWMTTKGGTYIASGVGGGVTGRGASLFLIDDSVKNREDADSPTYQRKAWDWYRSTAYTRMAPGGAIVLINTRWSDEDLAGKVLADMKEEGGEEWDILHLPAISDTGDALWPEWYPIETLENIKRTIGSRDWSALYQGMPSPAEGLTFRRDWIRYYKGAIPPNKVIWQNIDGVERKVEMRYYISCDYAVSKDSGDYTVLLVFAVDAQDNIYVVDMWREQSETEDWIGALMGLIGKWSPVAMFEEKGVILRAVDHIIAKSMQENSLYTMRVPLPSVGNKEVRSSAMQGRMSMGRIFLPSVAAWLADFESELLRFPTGAHDDIVDAFSLLGRGLLYLNKGKELRSEPHANVRVNAEGGDENMTMNDVFEYDRRVRISAQL